ncbi:unnamed protein product [Durusdinium trenchii]|uniref:Uncharacterized protein n=1 Tax=Durusdinium trenchii TaxID=1381693 RepID=A0ABP0PJ26_9DINO
MPVFVVCVSALCRLDYATQVTDIGAELINEMGLSYTVYYTAGCWPPAGPLDALQRRAHCNPEDFEIAASEFDALTGSLLRVRNVTKLNAKRLTAVKVTPDWRFVTFLGSLKEDVGNLYAVDAQDKDALKAIPLLSHAQLSALDAACEMHTQQVQEVLEDTRPDQKFVRQQARLSGFKHLQVIIPGIPALEFGGSLQGLPAQPWGTSLVYRAAFSFTCRQAMPVVEAVPIQFSKLAVVDFQLKNLTGARAGPQAFAASQVRVLNTRPVAPPNADEGATSKAHRYLSHCCPRFVPSKQGAELLFVAEDVAPEVQSSDWAPEVSLPQRLLAQMQLLEDSVTGRKLTEEAWKDVPQTPGVRGAISDKEMSQAMERHEAQVLAQGYTGFDFFLLQALKGALPCKEINADSQMWLGLDANNAFDGPTRDALRTSEWLPRIRSSSVLGIDAQVLAGSLAAGPSMGQVSFRQLLYNVKSLGHGLVLGGCKPIRAAGRQGHMRMEAALESVKKTLRISDSRGKYTTWLACLTTDQKVAIVESEDTKNWINMSMPYPFWTRNHPFVWCLHEHQESCFEVWSNPNPNE